MYPSLVRFLFSIFVTSITATKCLNFSIYARAFSPAVFIVCLPAFVSADLIGVGVVWLLLGRCNGFVSFLCFSMGCFISLVTLGAAASQLAFYFRTGGQLDWNDAASFALDQEARNVLLSEGAIPLSFAVAIAVISWVVKVRLFAFASRVLVAGENHARSTLLGLACKAGLAKTIEGETRVSLLPSRDADPEFGYGYDSDDLDELQIKAPRASLRDVSPARPMNCPVWVPVAFLAMVLMGIIAALTLLDSDRPYGPMFTTLPLSLLAMFESPPVQCASNSWPLPELIEEARWEPPSGNFKGWAPGTANDIVETYRQRQPEWLPSDLPDGFGRWKHDAKQTGLGELLNKTAKDRNDGCPDPLVLDPFYNPANDPMKISNLDKPFLDPLQDVLHAQSVKIKHVVLILMESMREELFPLQQGSQLYDVIMKSHDKPDVDQLNELLSHVSPNAERITGLSGGWTSKNGTSLERPESEWNDQTKEGFGGININGGITPSSISTKSLAAAHCGTWPLPVDKFEEAETESYQPCIPQILELFNEMKPFFSPSDFREQRWYPAFFQALTDRFDRQYKFDSSIGFRHIVTRQRISQEAEDILEQEEINYFGYADTSLKKHITEYVAAAKAGDQRMFLSHFTGTTHHPWTTPKWFDQEDYLGSDEGLMAKHRDLNRYLNTVRFHDMWTGELMQILDDSGIANETLVVFVGDHGQAFKEDVIKTGTYDNPHISNHRVPITFRHPHLPRVQHRANVTSLSILPTILDLLISTGSLNSRDSAAAADLVHDYEGQSLIRPFKTREKGRRAWNYSLVNPGGRMLTITSSDTPWRLVLPLDEHNKKTAYIFSDLGRDPTEQDTLSAWSILRLAETVRQKVGDEAADWVVEADKVGLWWASERKRLWRYSPS